MIAGTLTPCKPERPTRDCEGCARHMPGIPSNPELRGHTVVMDATVLQRNGSACQMRVEYLRTRDAA